jgi:uncharacterized damage-inducible protein DinB
VNTKDIATLYNYNRWANRRTLGSVRPLDHDEFTRNLGTSHGSVRGTLVHTMWAEWIWLQRWHGESPKRVFDEGEFANLAAVAAYWQGLEDERKGFIAGLTDEHFEQSITYENIKSERCTYTLGHMLQHVVNHSTYHRGQIVTLLRQLGHLPAKTDFLEFFDVAGEKDAR